MLTGPRIATAIEVRTAPRSRHNPQFNAETLAVPFGAFDVEYVHADGLGGSGAFARRTPCRQIGGWRNLSFRGYADYMQSPEFAENLFWLMRLAEERRVALAICVDDGYLTECPSVPAANAAFARPSLSTIGAGPPLAALLEAARTST